MSELTKDYDVIVWGASGFTGRLVAEYLNGRYGLDGELRWAMGGRSEEKLKAVAAEIGAEGAPIVTADASDLLSLKTMAAKTRVVCTTVGPYQNYGTALVEACVDAGVDYVDLCGEPAWMRRMIDQHHARAKETGARIVHSCGFDSIPFDLGVLYAQKLAKEAFGAPAIEVKGRVKAMKGGFSGGTAASLVATVEAGGTDPFVRRVMRDPYSLAPDDDVSRPRQPDGRTPRYDRDARAWVAPFIMADINTRNVHRSNLLGDYPYGEDFKYSEMMMTPNRVAATMTATGLGFFAGSLTVGPMRSFMKSFVLPKPGEGPSKRERETGFYSVLFIAKSEDGRTVTAKVKGDRDPGYGSTSKMLGEAAVCLAKDIAKDAREGGVLTPAAAMGDALIDRLQKNAGLTFEKA
ncbi:MAG: saccharopine dehydrogenase NADP-binding domain-containing protein [Pseudomonadota bacterium]